MIMMNNFQQLNIVNAAGCKPATPVNPGDKLIANYPNPFVQSTTITFTTKGGHTLIQVINAVGQLIATLVDQDYPVAGTYSTSFNSDAFAAGVYYARLQNGPVQQVRAMLKVR